MGEDVGTARERLLESSDTSTSRLLENKQTALARLDEDERVAKEQMDKEAQDLRQGTKESLSSRGFNVAQEGGLVGQNLQETEKTIQDQLDALARASGRSRTDTETDASRGLYDINLGKAQGLSDIQLAQQRGQLGLDTGKTRTLEDLKTGARRDALDTQTAVKTGTENANLALKQTQAQAEAERARQKLLNAQRAGLNSGGGNPFKMPNKARKLKKFKKSNKVKVFDI